ncbi:MAG: hypothetical protein JHC33_12985 [Ignisphaera sp.]|nr:hypothetical protein [Ignisphaera sp.]
MDNNTLYNMSDEELEKAYLEARQSENSEHVTEESVEEPIEDSIGEHVEEQLDNQESEEVDEITDEEVEQKEVTTPQLEVKEPRKIKVKANGREVELTEDEVFAQFGTLYGKANDYTKKMQAIKPWRKTIDAIEQAKLNHQDVSLMIDALRGDKEAIATVLKRTGVDTLELDTENSNYVPKNYGRDERVMDIEEVIEEISQDPEYATTHKVLSKDWDNSSLAKMTDDPNMIRLLHIDVKDGTYDKVRAVADKLKMFDTTTRTDLEYYALAAAELYDKSNRQNVQAQQQIKTSDLAQKIAAIRQQEAKRVTTTNAASKRKAAAPTKAGSSKPTGVINYLDDSDEAFEDWFSNLQKQI